MRRFFVTLFSCSAYTDNERGDSVRRMRCSTIGLIAFSFGIGVLIGGLLPSWVVVWILGITLLVVGSLLLHC